MWFKRELHQNNPKVVSLIFDFFDSVGDIPPDAREWAGEQLELMNPIGKKLAELVVLRAEGFGVTLGFANVWISKQMESETPPDAFVNAMYLGLREGYVQDAYADYVWKTMSNPPNEFVDAVREYLGKLQSTPRVDKSLHTLLSYRVNEGNTPGWMIKIIDEHILKYGVEPQFAERFMKSEFRENRTTKVWRDFVDAHIKKKGYPQYVAYEWAEGVLMSGKAPKEWITAIETFKKMSGDYPHFARKFMSQNKNSDWYDKYENFKAKPSDENN